MKLVLLLVLAITGSSALAESIDASLDIMKCQKNGCDMTGPTAGPQTYPVVFDKDGYAIVQLSKMSDGVTMTAVFEIYRYPEGNFEVLGSDEYSQNSNPPKRHLLAAFQVQTLNEVPDTVLFNGTQVSPAEGVTLSAVIKLAPTSSKH